VQAAIESPKFIAECSAEYRAKIAEFITNKVINRMAETRVAVSMHDGLDRPRDWDDSDDLSTLATQGMYN